MYSCVPNAWFKSGEKLSRPAQVPCTAVPQVSACQKGCMEHLYSVAVICNGDYKTAQGINQRLAFSPC